MSKLLDHSPSTRICRKATDRNAFLQKFSSWTKKISQGKARSSSGTVSESDYQYIVPLRARAPIAWAASTSQKPLCATRPGTTQVTAAVAVQQEHLPLQGPVVCGGLHTHDLPPSGTVPVLEKVCTTGTLLSWSLSLFGLQIGRAACRERV